MGLDYGLSKIGVAVVDESANTLALPVCVLSFNDQHLFYGTFSELLEEYHPTTLVVGNPFLHTYPSTEETDAFNAFIQTITRVSGLTPILFDEVMTTKEAQRLTQNHPKKIKDDDAIAASIMLQAYVDCIEE